MPIELETIKRALVMLPAGWFAHLTRALMKVDRNPELAFYVPLVWQVRLAFADWLSHLGFVTDHQAVTILKCREKVFADWADWVSVAPATWPGFNVTVSDGRWVHTNFDKTWLDLQSEEEVDCLTNATVTHVTCDVGALLHRFRDRLLQLGVKE